jgi:VIT1/CCC1 family predicted Fe2+/Mn2+ transporter
MMLNDKHMKVILESQRNEITEHFIYLKLSQSVAGPNSEVLKKIADDELRHYDFWKRYTGIEVKASRWKIFKFYWIARIFGITFSIKLMERGEISAQSVYNEIARDYPEVQSIVDDEDRHEHELIDLIDEERLNYVGSVVLGLNDALVELTGALAGLTFALQNTRLIALAGLITGIAASLSMAASEYLSTKAESGEQDPVKSSVYTGIAYVLTVIILIFPYLIFADYLLCLGFTILNALIIIFLFTFYVSVAKDLPFRKRFTEMASISLGVALISFGIGYLIRTFLGIEV